MLSRTFFIGLFVTLLFPFINIAQSDYLRNNFHLIDRGLHLDFGFNSVIPTNNIVFAEHRKEKAGIIKQPLTNEWSNTGLGGYIDLNYNVGYNYPLFVGASFRWTPLYKFKEDYTRKLALESIQLPDVDWTFRNRTRLFNYSLYSELSFFRRPDYSFFLRGDVGLGHYRMANKVSWEVAGQSDEELNVATINTANSFVLTGDLGLGFRWQFSEKLGLRAHVGYQFQTANNFYRSNYVENIEASLNDKHYYPVEEDFSVTSPADTGRPVKLQHENLYFQVGVSFRLDGSMLAEKPVLYLYPEDTTEVNVSVNLSNHDFAHAYPAYNEESGWNVTASPNGDLIDEETGRKYYTLFWETEGPPIASGLDKGFVVSGNNSADFLETKLEELGLNYREMNEFIIYWLPQMENNNYNAVYFAFEEYEATSQLSITPQPDNIIRIMMLWEPLEEKIELKEQILPATPSREGFVAVEWGGTKGTFFNKRKIRI